MSKDEIEGIVNIPGLTIHELPIDTYQDQGVEGPVYVENNAFSNRLNVYLHLNQEKNLIQLF